VSGEFKIRKENNDDVDKFTFQIDGNILKLNKLNEQMDEQFNYFSNQKFDIDLFKKSAVKFFDEHSEVKLHDRFFNNFTILWQILIQNGFFLPNRYGNWQYK
jgi:hypothetical protein